MIHIFTIGDNSQVNFGRKIEEVPKFCNGVLIASLLSSLIMKNSPTEIAVAEVTVNFI
jgi:hypothetical protein